MGFWRWAGEIAGYVGAPFTGGATLVFAKSARNAVGDLIDQVTGRKVGEDGDTNTISNKQNAENALTDEKGHKETIERLEKIEKKLGISQQENIEKINEIKKNREEEIKELIEKSKGASPEERKRIMDEIVIKTKEEQAAINKILQESNNKLEQKALKTLEQANQAQQDGDKKQAAILFAEAQKQQQTIKEQNEIMAVLKKKASEKEQATKQLVQSVNKTWYQDLNFSSWQL